MNKIGRILEWSYLPQKIRLGPNLFCIFDHFVSRVPGAYFQGSQFIICCSQITTMVLTKYTVNEKYSTRVYTKFSTGTSTCQSACVLRTMHAPRRRPELRPGGALAAPGRLTRRMVCMRRFMRSNHASNAPNAARQILSYCRIMKWEKLIFILSFIYILYEL